MNKFGKTYCYGKEDENDSILLEIKKLDKIARLILWIGAPVLLLLPIVAIILDRFFDFTNNAPINEVNNEPLILGLQQTGVRVGP